MFTPLGTPTSQLSVGEPLPVYAPPSVRWHGKPHGTRSILPSRNASRYALAAATSVSRVSRLFAGIASQFSIDEYFKYASALNSQYPVVVQRISISAILSWFTRSRVPSTYGLSLSATIDSVNAWHVEVSSRLR